jgi:hypothetical protein
MDFGSLTLNDGQNTRSELPLQVSRPSTNFKIGVDSVAEVIPQ